MKTKNFDHEYFMKIAIKEAIKAGKRGDRPIGAIIVHNNKIIAKSSSQLNSKQSDIHHAENTAIFKCFKYLKKYGKECVLYTTVEPCLMCLSTIRFAHIRNIFFAIEDKFTQSESNFRNILIFKNRFDNYVNGICYEEALKVFKKYSTERDIRVALTGIK